MKRTIDRINFSMELMEVIVLLEDRTGLQLTRELSNRLGKSLSRRREGAVNPDAPACSPQFGTNEWRRELSHLELLPSPSKFSLILPHDLLRRTRLKKR